MLGQQADVFRALAQCWHTKRNNLEPVIEIPAHASFAHPFGKGAVGGGDDARIETAHRVFPYPPYAPILQGTQKFDLHGWREFSDLVQK